MAISRSNNTVCMQTVVDMFGIDPLKFNGLYPLCIDYLESGCEEYWTQFFEHGNLISREELAMELYRAELEVASYLGQFPFPTYVCDEDVKIEGCYSNPRSMGVSLEDYVFKTKWRCIQDFGVYEDVTLGVADVTYINHVDNENGTDSDGDGVADIFYEFATIVFDYSAITDPIDINDVRLEFMEFENYDFNRTICPILSVEDDTVAQTMTFTVNTWNLVRPELYMHRSFVETKAFDACDLSNYVDQVNVVIKQKTCKPDGWIYCTENGCSGRDCEETAYPFCALPIEKEPGYFKITIGDVDEDGCFVSGHACAPCCKPTRIEVNYLSGCTGCYSTNNDVSFCNLLERAIIYLAIARLPRSLCECGCSSQFVEEIKYDTSITYSNSPVSFNFPYALRNTSPFGTKIGELEAYKILTTLEDNLC